MGRGLDPKALEDKPNLPIHLAFYAESFWVLSNRRGYNEVGMQPIPISDIASYLTINPWFDSAVFVKHITRMDSAYLRHHHDKQTVNT